MKHAKRIAVVALLACMMTIPWVGDTLLAAEREISIGMGYEFAVGTYGTEERTGAHRIPVTIAYQPGEHTRFSLEVPYVYQSSSATVLLGGQRFPHMSGTPSAGGGTGMMGGTPGTVVRTDAQRGVGDIAVNADYVLIGESTSTPMLRPGLYLKIPTADEAKGLGTGEFDVGAGITVAKWIGNWSAGLDAMYVIPGTSTQYQPKPYWTYSASVNRPITDRIAGGLSLSGAEAAFADTDNALEAGINISCWYSDSTGLSAYLTTGLSDASADIGSGMFGSFRF